MSAEIIDHLREVGYPLAAQFEGMPVEEAMAILAFIVGAVMSRPDLKDAPLEQMLALHTSCVGNNVLVLRPARERGEYPALSRNVVN